VVEKRTALKAAELSVIGAPGLAHSSILQDIAGYCCNGIETMGINFRPRTFTR
jgi:hypothetical protein